MLGMSTDYASVSGGYSPEEIAQLGEKYYFDKLKDELEEKYKGYFLILDITTKKYVVAPDKLEALQKAEKELGEQMFYIMQIGNLHRPMSNFKRRPYAWTL